jgi:hypothetical protein
MVEVGLVSCVKTKKGESAPPKELYTSDYFEKMSSYAEKYHDDWYIISAKYGLLNPEGDAIEPYDETLRDYTKSEKKEWSEDLAEELAEKGILSQDTELVIHAGKDYYEELVPLVKEQGVKIQIPTEGLGIGEKKAWYKQRL